MEGFVENISILVRQQKVEVLLFGDFDFLGEAGSKSFGTF